MRWIAVAFAIGLPILLFFAGSDYQRISVGLSGTTISIDVADTSIERRNGLSNRPALGIYQGMLFEFDQPLIPAFWMKDMRFPLDIIWIDAQYKIVGFEEDVAPSTFPDTFSPETEIVYVLEINAGYVQEWGISVGDVISR